MTFHFRQTEPNRTEPTYLSKSSNRTGPISAADTNGDYTDILRMCVDKVIKELRLHHRCPSRLNICRCRDGDFENLWVFKSVTVLTKATASKR